MTLANCSSSRRIPATDAFKDSGSKAPPVKRRSDEGLLSNILARRVDEDFVDGNNDDDEAPGPLDNRDKSEGNGGACEL